MIDHIRYHPVRADIESLVSADSVDEVLFVAATIPAEAVVPVPTARYMDSPTADLPQGTYVFVGAGGRQRLMVIGRGAPSAAPAAADWSEASGQALGRAFGWFEAWWEEAHDVPAPRFAPQDIIRVVDEATEARVLKRSFANTWSYRCRVGDSSRWLQELDLDEITSEDDPYEWIEDTPGDPFRMAATITRSKISSKLTDTVFSFRATKTIFRAYQFQPVLRMLASERQRILIADEVGLGKTIEAGLIWTELDARQQADTVLVVCPSMLVSKWQAEMRNRFGYEVDELDTNALDDFLDRLEEDRRQNQFRGVCSLERLRSWNGLARAEELGLQFDLIIVDEAHSMRNSGTRSHDLGTALSEWADALVFLSATPLNLGNRDLYNLLNILTPGDFEHPEVLETRLEPTAILNKVGASLRDELVSNVQRSNWLRDIANLEAGTATMRRPEYIELERLLALPTLGPADKAAARRLIASLHELSSTITRTRKVDLKDHKAVREAVRIDVDWTSAEAAFYVAVDTWQRERARALGKPVGFVTQMPLRLAGTCLPAARDKLLSEQRPSSGAPSWDPRDFEGTEQFDSESKAAGDPDRAPDSLLALANELGDVDTKFDAFVEHITPMIEDGHRILLFTFSVPTVKYLEGRLRDRHRVVAMHGQTDRDTRGEIMVDFRQGEYDMLLATRVASEGLDFEFCDVVVNYDLPWNPMEVEQRIGRIDRFGQKSDKIFVLNFHTPGTIETDIVARLHDRLGVFRSSIGELEPILQETTSELKQAMFDFNLTEAQRRQRVDDLLTAVEDQKHRVNELETAKQYLTSTDDAAIDELESDLLSTGHYVGQLELVALIQDWIASSEGGTCRVTDDGRHVIVRGSAPMAAQVDKLGAAGEGSRLRLRRLARSLRDGTEMVLCLDSEFATTEANQDLLNASHPLIRAALAVPGFKQVRFASVRVPGPQSGTFLVLLSLAEWTGAAGSTELWTAGVNLENGQDFGEMPGDALLAAVAAARVSAGPAASGCDLESALDSATQALNRRQNAEQERRRSQNEAIVEQRKASLNQVHTLKVSQIRQKIQTLRESGNSRMIRLFEAQLDNQADKLAKAIASQEERRTGSLQLEEQAVLIVQLQPSGETVETETGRQ